MLLCSSGISSISSNFLAEARDGILINGERFRLASLFERLRDVFRALFEIYEVDEGGEAARDGFCFEVEAAAAVKAETSRLFLGGDEAVGATEEKATSFTLECPKKKKKI